MGDSGDSLFVVGVLTRRKLLSRKGLSSLLPLCGISPFSLHGFSSLLPLDGLLSEIPFRGLFSRLKLGVVMSSSSFSNLTGEIILSSVTPVMVASVLC